MSKGSARRPGDIKPGAWEAIFAPKQQPKAIKREWWEGFGQHGHRDPVCGTCHQIIIGANCLANTLNYCRCVKVQTRSAP